MIVCLGLVLIALCVAITASADIKIITRAVETATAFMNLPVTDNALWRQHDA